MFQEISEKYLHDGEQYVKVFKKKLKPITDLEFVKYLTAHHVHLVLGNKIPDIKKFLYTEYLKYQNEKNMEPSFDYDDEVDFVEKKNAELDLFDVKASAIMVEKHGRQKIVQRLKQEAINYNRSIDTNFLHIGMINDAVEIVGDNIRKTKLDEFKNKIKFDATVEADWDKLIDMMRLKDDGLKELHIKAFKHIVWQIKRKLNEKDCKWHLAMVLHGKQGCGKSEFLKKFFSVLDELYLLFDGEDISDKFNAAVFQNHFVGNLDELTKLNETSIEAVKSFITRESKTERKMFSQISSEYRQNLTIVGSTNRPINKVITDFTGMRRFWQMDIDTNFKTMDFDIIEDSDFLNYWLAIDENDDVGYYSHKDEEMTNYQETFKAVPPVQEFIEMYGYVSDYSIETEWVEVVRIYDDWRDFCKKFNYKVFTINAFRGSLIERDFQIKQKRVGTKIKWLCRISKEEDF